MENYIDIIRKYPHDKSYLIEILRDIQDVEYHISNDAIASISKELNILEEDIKAVVSFYSMLTDEPTGKYAIRLCKTICCKLEGELDLLETIKKELSVDLDQTTSDGLFSIHQTECIGMCDKAPAMLINDQPYTHLTKEKVLEIIKEYKEKC